MKKIKVRVLNCHHKSWWYYKHIGQIIEVSLTSNNGCSHKKPTYDALPEYHAGGFIYTEDCQIVEDFKMLKSHQDQRSGEPA